MELSPWTWTVSPGEGIVPKAVSWTVAPILLEGTSVPWSYVLSRLMANVNCDSLASLYIWLNLRGTPERYYKGFSLLSKYAVFILTLYVIIYKMQRREKGFSRCGPQITLNRITWGTGFPGANIEQLNQNRSGWGPAIFIQLLLPIMCGYVARQDTLHYF